MPRPGPKVLSGRQVRPVGVAFGRYLKGVMLLPECGNYFIRRLTMSVTNATFTRIRPRQDRMSALTDGLARSGGSLRGGRVHSQGHMQKQDRERKP